METNINLSQIRPGRFQPRTTFDEGKLLDLAESIQENGLIYPLILRRGIDRYEIIGGERRWRALVALALEQAQSIDLADAVKIVNEAGDWDEFFRTYNLDGAQTRANVLDNVPDEAQHVLAVVDNFQRADLTPWEEAQALRALQERYGYSLRELARRVGKSKSFVEDRLGLLGLSPEAVETAQDELDISVLREVSRRVEYVYQPALIETLKRMSDSMNSKELINFIQEAARMLDLNRWSLSDGSVYQPAVINRARLVRWLIKSTKPDEIIARLERMKTEYPHYLRASAKELLKEDYRFGTLARLLAGSTRPALDIWEWAAKAQGWTCANCKLKDLPGQIPDEERVQQFDWGAPCARYRNEGDADTCFDFIGTEEEKRVRVPYGVVSTVQDEDSITAHSGEWWSVDSVDAWVSLYRRASQIKRERKREDDKRQSRLPAMVIGDYIEKLEQYKHWFNLEHFQAHHCARCVNHLDTAGDGIPCRLVYEPLTDRRGETRGPEQGVLVSRTGMMVPRCEGFRLKDLSVIPPQEVSLPASLREKFVSLYDTVERSYRVGNSSLIWSPLNWLAQNLSEVDDNGVLIPVVFAGISEALALSTWQKAFTLYNPQTDQDEQWKGLLWGWLFNKNGVTTYDWGDWPRPWEDE